ncbi:MAG TPA: hypothetical protein VF828_03335 [Patescibacteria group bacterium]
MSPLHIHKEFADGSTEIIDIPPHGCFVIDYLNPRRRVTFSGAQVGGSVLVEIYGRKNYQTMVRYTLVPFFSPAVITGRIKHDTQDSNLTISGTF